MSEKIFFIYEHLRAEGKAVIHKSDCPWCRNGQGIHMRRGGRNGQWHGPFKTYKETYMFADELRRPIRNCSHCDPQADFNFREWVKEREQVKKVKFFKPPTGLILKTLPLIYLNGCSNTPKKGRLG